MTDAAQHLLDEALKLSTKERATLAADLLASLDCEPSPPGEVEAAWTAEIRSRLGRVRSGESGIPWEQVRDEIKARLSQRRGG